MKNSSKKKHYMLTAYDNAYSEIKVLYKVDASSIEEALEKINAASPYGLEECHINGYTDIMLVEKVALLKLNFGVRIDNLEIKK